MLGFKKREVPVSIGRYPVLLAFDRKKEVITVRSFTRMLFALTAVGAISVLFASPALASDSQPTITNESWSYSSVTFSDKSVAIVDGSANGIEQVQFTMPNGLPKSQKHGTCLVAANDNKPARGKRCGHIKIGTAYTNSGTLRSTGRFGMFTDYVRAGDMFYLVNGQWCKGKCGNKVWFKSRPKGRVLSYARVRVVRYFTWTAKVSVLARQSGSVDAKADCSATGVSASASAHAEGFAEAGGQVSSTFTAHTRAQAISGARNLAIAQIDRVALKEDVKAAVLIKLTVAAAVSCSSVTPPVTPPPVTPPPVTPPPVTPPPVNPQPAPVCFGSAAHLQVGGDAFLYCEVVVPSGATIAGETMQKVSGPSDANVNGLVPSDVRWDLTPCPVGRQCYRAHLWAGSTLGDLVVQFKVSAIFSTGSTTTGSTEVTVPIRPEVVF
jgi:hypothetical protein